MTFPSAAFRSRGVNRLRLTRLERSGIEVKQTHLAGTSQARSAVTAKAVPALLITCLPS
jgi:hypothetical protein